MSSQKLECAKKSERNTKKMINVSGEGVYPDSGSDHLRVCVALWAGNVSGVIKR